MQKRNQLSKAYQKQWETLERNLNNELKLMMKLKNCLDLIKLDFSKEIKEHLKNLDFGITKIAGGIMEITKII